MCKIEELVRPNIRALTAYKSARDEYMGTGKIFLDANESPFGKLNRYPDPHQQELKTRLSQIKEMPVENIFIGNGSDEIIDLVFRIFCTPGRDKCLSFFPSYGMYEVSAAINDNALIQIPLNQDFQIDKQIVARVLSMKNIKAIFICSPNNPTGNTLDPQYITEIIEKFTGIIVIDEAYIDFSETQSWKHQINIHKNLIVLQTLSKAWGLASVRIGIAFADKGIISLLKKIKPPYNVSTPNQVFALESLSHLDTFQSNTKLIKEEKERVRNELISIATILKIYPSDSNFLFIKTTDANKKYQALLTQGIVVRNRHNQIDNCLRISIGSPYENNQLIKCLKNEESTVFG